MVFGGLLWRQERLSVDLAGASSLPRAGCVCRRRPYICRMKTGVLGGQEQRACRGQNRSLSIL